MRRGLPDCNTRLCYLLHRRNCSLEVLIHRNSTEHHSRHRFNLIRLDKQKRKKRQVCWNTTYASKFSHFKDAIRKRFVAEILYSLALRRLSERSFYVSLLCCWCYCLRCAGDSWLPRRKMKQADTWNWSVREDLNGWTETFRSLSRVNFIAFSEKSKIIFISGTTVARKQLD